MKKTDLAEVWASKELRIEAAENMYCYIRYGRRKLYRTKEDFDIADYKSYLLLCMAEDHNMALMFCTKGTKLICAKEWHPSEDAYTHKSHMPKPIVGKIYTVSKSDVAEASHSKCFEELPDGYYTINYFDFAKGAMPTPDEALELYGDDFERDFAFASIWAEDKDKAIMKETLDRWENFRLHDLHTGDVVVMRAGYKGVCLPELNEIMLQHDGHIRLDAYNESMIKIGDKDSDRYWDIMKVYLTPGEFGGMMEHEFLAYDRDGIQSFNEKLQRTQKEEDSIA